MVDADVLLRLEVVLEGSGVGGTKNGRDVLV